MPEGTWEELCVGAVQQLGAAESRIAAALACHTRSEFPVYARCACGEAWNVAADRCTSPTVKALLGDA